MYLAFLLSGCVDLLSHYAKMPTGIEHVSLRPCVASLGFQVTTRAKVEMLGSIEHVTT